MWWARRLNVLEWDSYFIADLELDVDTMLVRLSLHFFLSLDKLKTAMFQHFLHSLGDVLCLRNQQALPCRCVGGSVGAERHPGMETLIQIEWSHVRRGRDIVVVGEFDHRYSASPIVLHVVAIRTETLFDFLIGSLGLAVSLRVIDRW